jgi:hypothetical protein
MEWVLESMVKKEAFVIPARFSDSRKQEANKGSLSIYTESREDTSGPAGFTET